MAHALLNSALHGYSDRRTFTIKVHVTTTSQRWLMYCKPNSTVPPKWSTPCYIPWTFTDKLGNNKMSEFWMGFGVSYLSLKGVQWFIYHGHLISSALTYSEKHYHAEHWQQGRYHYTDEDGEFLWLPLMARLLPGAAMVLYHGQPERRWPRLGFIDAGGEAVVEKRSPLCHSETCLFTSFTTSWSALNN